MSKEFGLKLRTLRKERNCTQKQLAEWSGLSIATIQGYEQGKYEPKKQARKRLAKALRVDELALTLEDPLEMLEYIQEQAKIVPEIKDLLTLVELVDKFDTRLGDIVTRFNLLNNVGRNKVNDYVLDMSTHPSYVRADDSEEAFWGASDQQTDNNNKKDTDQQ